jgi:hypothetical protein
MSAFAEHADQLPKLLAALLKCQPARPNRLPRELPRRGVYLFSEKGHHLYVGRSRTLRRRIGQHCQPGAGPGIAGFAVLLAREKTGLRATYRCGQTGPTSILPSCTTGLYTRQK